MPRAMLVYDLCAASGWLDQTRYYEAGMASVTELCRFHTPEYIAALMRAEIEQDLPAALRQQTRIGADANVIHPVVFRRPATSAGAALLMAGLLAQGATVHAPCVGNHHGQPARASGFCFVNDIALAILRLRDLGFRRIAYLDLDAHHGDGVEAAFATDPEVLTISVHEAGRWPRTGTVHDAAHGIYNFPVPPGFNDTELDYLMQAAILPRLRAFAPEVILLLPGADALADDRMSGLSLSNNALWRAVGDVRALGGRLAVLGGGGYNPFALARSWAGIWARLNGIAIPEVLPAPVTEILATVRFARQAGAVPAHWLTTLADPASAGPVREAVKRLGDA
ncbi:MAG: acetoin utilization protein AcuC [Acidocella sp. 20-61-6]|nr:MAG: acetoin utilization protein AcuC [Acidocella sp. 20-61-6]